MNARPLKTSPSLRRRLFTALVAAVCLAPVALAVTPADAAPSYKPPRKKAAQRTETTASRSGDSRSATSQECTFNWAAPLTVALPLNSATEEAQTTLEKPPIVLYIGGPKTVVIQLKEADTTNVIWEQRQTIRKKGFVQIPYPTEQAPLALNKTYKWEVKPDCQKTVSDMGRLIAYGQFTRVAPTAELNAQLSQASSADQKAAIYASEGLWTEAFITSSSAADQLSLLEQLGFQNKKVLEAARSTLKDKSPITPPTSPSNPASHPPHSSKSPEPKGMRCQETPAAPAKS